MDDFDLDKFNTSLLRLKLCGKLKNIKMLDFLVLQNKSCTNIVIICKNNYIQIRVTNSKCIRVDFSIKNLSIETKGVELKQYTSNSFITQSFGLDVKLRYEAVLFSKDIEYINFDGEEFKLYSIYNIAPHSFIEGDYYRHVYNLYTDTDIRSYAYQYKLYIDIAESGISSFQISKVNNFWQL